MADPGPVSTARPFPDGVPTLVDAAAGLTLRALSPDDLPAVVEQARDPQMIRWTSVPDPVGGYQADDALDFLELTRTGWESGRRLGWAVEAERDGGPRFCGGIDLRLDGDGLAEVGYGLHPRARGRSLTTAALRLVCDYGFARCGVRVIRWRSRVGNWASRRVASRVGFRFDGRVRRLLPHRGELVDGWLATLTAEDPRVPAPWLDPTPLAGPAVRLRAFRPTDADAVVATCADPRTRHWLAALPDPYGPDEARAYLEAVAELGASAAGLVWCLADEQDRCVGSISLEGLDATSGRGEIGYWTHPEARGRGLMTEALGLVSRHALSTGLCRSLTVRCAVGNRASRHVAEAAGYRQIGVQPAAERLADGTQTDLVLYAWAGPQSAPDP